VEGALPSRASCRARSIVFFSGIEPPRERLASLIPYPAAVEELKVEGTLRRRCRLRQCKYLNNVIEQDHRVSKRRVWLARGYQSIWTAWRTLQGIEAVHMIRKGRARWVAKGDPLAQMQFIDELFGLVI
jgi:transposase-like protein